MNRATTYIKFITVCIVRAWYFCFSMFLYVPLLTLLYFTNLSASIEAYLMCIFVGLPIAIVLAVYGGFMQQVYNIQEWKETYKKFKEDLNRHL